MRDVSQEYRQEEQRLRGAKPRIKAVISPFDLDYGLAPGSGTYVHTAYGDEPGKLVMAAGYYTAGSWTSPVMQTFSPYLCQAVPAWEEPAGAMDLSIWLRSGDTPAAVAQAPYVSLTPGNEFSLASFFQVRAEFQETRRAWAVDHPEEADEFTAYAVVQVPDPGYESYAGEAAGCVVGLRLTGGLALPESEILGPGRVRVELAGDFSELRAADHVLVADNRAGQWLTRAGYPGFSGVDRTPKQVALHHGWELPSGQVEWQLVYQGELQRLSGMAHGWQESHRVRLESRDAAAARLQQVIGAPAPGGVRRPFMRGTYRAQGELTQTTPAWFSEPAPVGSGTATLRLQGTYRGEYPQDYLLEVQTGGEVGSATFRWSVNQGQSWREMEIKTAGAEAPVELEEGLAVYWDAGPGADLVTGDRWTLTATPKVYHYRVYGGPFAAIAAVYLNDEETTDRVAADAATGEILVTGRSARVEARVVKDYTTHPIDIIADILTEVELGQVIHQDSFALAKSLTPEYAIGVCFENHTAAQAIREIVRRCLYDLWVDFGEIKIEAYLGEDPV